MRYVFAVFLLQFSFHAAAQPGGGGTPPPGGAASLFHEAVLTQGGRTIRLAGWVQPSRSLVVTAPVDGTVSRLQVATGDRVRTGASFLTLTRIVTGETFRPVQVNATFPGAVSRVHIQEGQQVKAGQELLTLVDLSSLKIEAALSNRDAREVRLLLGRVIELGDSVGLLYSGRFSSLSQEPDYATGLFTLTLTLQPQQGLFPGLFLFSNLSLGGPAGIFIEPTALVRREGKSYLWVVNAERKLELREVAHGPVQGEKVQIISGLSEKERYIPKPSGKEEEGLDSRDYRERVQG